MARVRGADAGRRTGRRADRARRRTRRLVHRADRATVRRSDPGQPLPGVDDGPDGLQPRAGDRSARGGRGARAVRVQAAALRAPRAARPPRSVRGALWPGRTTCRIQHVRDRPRARGGGDLTGMSSACRRAVRKSEKEGVRVEEAHGVEFADEYYAQLEDVFAKQSLRPPYGVERVRELVRCLEPTGNLLLLRAVSPAGEGIATAIFPVLNQFGYFWGGASWRRHQILRPNEAVFWHAMRRLGERGVPVLDLGGGGEYKRKY